MYKVIKTIKGRRYLYLQETYREGGKVKTRNQYIGPVSGNSANVGSEGRASPSATTKTAPVGSKPSTFDDFRGVKYSLKASKPGGLKIRTIRRAKPLTRDQLARAKLRRIKEESDDFTRQLLTVKGQREFNRQNRSLTEKIKGVFNRPVAKLLKVTPKGSK